MSNNSSEIKLSPIVIIIGIIILIFIIKFYKSPNERKRECIEMLMNDGYNYDDAQSDCEDAYWNSVAR